MRRVPRRHRYYERLRLLIAHPAMLLRAPFPSPGGTSCARLVRVPPRCSAAPARVTHDAHRPRVCCAESPMLRPHEEAMRSPRFLERLCARALLFDPGGASAPMILGRSGAAFHGNDGVGLRDDWLSGLHHTAHALAVYASQSSSRAPTQDSLPAGDQPLPGGTHFPARRFRRFPRRSSGLRFLLLRASWRTVAPKPRTAIRG